MKSIGKAGLFLIASLLAAQAYAQGEGSVILKHHFEQSGQELWNQVGTVTIDGRWVDENYYGHSIKLTFKAPDKIHIRGTYSKQPFIEAYNGSYGWIVAPWKNKQEVQRMDTREQLVTRNSFSLGSPLYSVKDQLVFAGLSPVEGEVYHSFTYEDSQIKKTFFLGRDDHRLYYEKIEFDGDEVLKIYETYRSYSGLNIPTAVRFRGEGLDRELVFDEVFLGLGARDSMFEPPQQK